MSLEISYKLKVTIGTSTGETYEAYAKYDTLQEAKTSRVSLVHLLRNKADTRSVIKDMFGFNGILLSVYPITMLQVIESEIEDDHE